MIIFINPADDAELREPGELSKFRVDIAGPGARLQTIEEKLPALISFEDRSTAWVSLSGLLHLHGAPSDSKWRADIDRMIEKARPHGWVRDTPKLAIKAHVVWDE